MSFRPMLAGKAPADLSTLRYPVLVSPKLDGIRCLILGGQAVSRTLKPIPNRFVQSQLAGLPEGLDGELICGTFNETQSAVMSVDGEPNFTFHVFDCATDVQSATFERRFNAACLCMRPPRVQIVPHDWALTWEQLEVAEDDLVRQGHEGAMIRDPNGPYKFGRSTTKEGYLLKLKRFEDSEAVVIGAVERMHNENALETDNLGHAKRSHAKAGKVPAGDLGALMCRTPEGVEFEIGSGFTAEQRAQYWKYHTDPHWTEVREGLVGRTVCYKHQPHGAKDAPRCPVFKGFRSD